MRLATAAKKQLKQVRFPLLRRWIRAYFAWRYQAAEMRKYERWRVGARVGPPPPAHKEAVVRQMGIDFRIETLVETGTFEGRMVEAVERNYTRIYTIELDAMLAAEAAERFRDRLHVTVLEGDSGILLPLLLAQIHEPAVFWLDAHYSGGPTARGEQDTPIMQELKAIAGHQLRAQHVVLIDDAREFVGGGYPTLGEMRDWARDNGFETFVVEDDIIRIYNSRQEL